MEKDKLELSGVDEANNNDSSTDVESGSESDDTSSTSSEATPFDEEDCERNRERCLRDLVDLERQFHDLKERFYRERISYMNNQLQQVKNGTAAEYLKKLTALEDNWRTRNEVADVLRRLQLDQVETVHEGERSAVDQNYENSKRLLYERLRDDIENKIAKLESDKRNADINLELWLRDSNRDKLNSIDHHAAAAATTSGNGLKRPLSPTILDPSISPNEKRRKPVPVSGPYVVYMLKENDILEDWNLIRRAALQSEYYDRMTFST